MQMETQRLTGPEAGGLKYDLLTALSVAGLNGSPTLQTSLMRLIALVTARYNWRADEFSVGQRDMARMWSVNERTVKREMKRLTDARIVLCKQPGVRGRVGSYRLNYARIAELSEPCWPLVGPDFERRMAARYRSGDVKVVQMAAYTKTPESETHPSETDGTWHAVLKDLEGDHAGLVNSWFGRLRFLGLARGTLSMEAPSAFVQRYIETHHLPLLVAAVERQIGPVTSVRFEGGTK
ncbi:hypothetical protein ABMC89_18515 [Sulfitobacter sp. HNIBRBA3233]|uniref:hypothetical protein n=1 Tax=Sulfitobacter marinivivus TaxID=3158558 RepID=UPI0032DF98CA